MRPQLIVDCGSRVLSALLLTADGQLVPCSQEIRQVATRHVSTGVLFEPHISEDPDFIWEDALETLSKASPHNFFQRARRIGLRRPWDPQASPDALQLASPLAVLSSAAALADRLAATSVLRVSLALLDALLDPTFTFVADRQLAFFDVDPVVIVPARTGRHARLVLQKLFRRRGFRPPTIVRHELAAAMALFEQSAQECVVIDSSGDDLHLHRVTIERHADERRFRSAASTTVRGLGWSHWLRGIAAALQTAPSSSFDRALTSLLTGSPESLAPRVTLGVLQSVLDDAWIDAQRPSVTELLREPLASIGATDLPIIFAGEIFTLDAVRRLFGGTAAIDAPVLDSAVRNVATALSWRRDGDSRQLVLTPEGSLRINTFHGEAIEIVRRAQLPAPGEACHVETAFRFVGEGAADKSFLVHLSWGADRAPEGNATLCAAPLELRDGRDDTLRLTVDLRRSRGGTRLHGSVEARLTHDAAATRMQFAEQLEVRR
jgi:hypothetical protein